MTKKFHHLVFKEFHYRTAEVELGMYVHHNIQTNKYEIVMCDQKSSDLYTVPNLDQSEVTKILSYPHRKKLIQKLGTI